MCGRTDAGTTRPALAASAATAACCAVGCHHSSLGLATLMHFAFAFDLSEFVDGLEEGAAAGDQRNRSGSGAGRAAAAGRGR